MSNALRKWLTTRAWPLWLQHGVDWQAGAFNESLTLDGYRSTASFRRLRVLARQIYVFSRAASHGLVGAEAAVDLGLTFLLRRARQPDGGYAWRFNLAGEVIDDRRDLYDHAFVLLALASVAYIRPDAALHQAALELDAFITTHLRHATEGFGESIPPSLPRRQNPHMHLLEACLAAAECFGDERFLARAQELITLFTERLWDRETGTLPEYFSNDLIRETAGGRHVWEPGHHCEWIWLLDWYERLAGKARLEEISQRLWQNVKTCGLTGPGGALLDEVWSDGTAKTLSSRLWPQVERLKSGLILHGGALQERARAEAALWPYLREDGLWYEYQGPDGEFATDLAPASSLYHLTSGILFRLRFGAHPNSPPSDVLSVTFP